MLSDVGVHWHSRGTDGVEKPGRLFAIRIIILTGWQCALEGRMRGSKEKRR